MNCSHLDLVDFARLLIFFSKKDENLTTVQVMFEFLQTYT